MITLLLLLLLVVVVVVILLSLLISQIDNIIRGVLIIYLNHGRGQG